MDPTDDTNKSCAFCGAIVSQEAISCPKCGKGVFESQRESDNNISGESIKDHGPRKNKGFFNFFKKSRPKAKAKPRTSEQMVKKAFANEGIEVTTSEISEIFKYLWKSIDFKTVLPEELMHSKSAELEYYNSKYNIRISMFLLNGAGQISQDVQSTLLAAAVYWATVSEIAKAKGIKMFALKEKQRIAVCDYTGFSRHPIYTLLPDLLNINVLR